MCEEMKNPRISVPRAMISSILINGVLAFAMLIALLYCAENLETAFSSPTGYPLIEIFAQAMSSVRGAAAVTAFMIFIAFITVIGAVAASSRQL